MRALQLLGGLILTGLLLLSASVQAEPPACEDPIYAQFAARIEERATAELRLEGWREFLHNHPDNPCAEGLRAYVAQVESSGAAQAEAEQKDKWEQEARGGVIEPGRKDFPAHMILTDVVGRNRLRLVSELIVLSDKLRKQWRLDPMHSDDASVLWTQILRAEYAPLKWLGINVDVPAVAATLDEEGFDWALGNMTLGLRGIWGRHLSGDRYPWVISGGIVWSPGSSAWSGEDRKMLLNAAAFGAAHVFHLFRYNAPDYVFHLQSQLGLERHFLSLGVAYHVFSGGGHVEKIWRMDLGYDWRITDWLAPGLALLMSVGQGDVGLEPLDVEWYFFCQLSPQVRFRFDGFVGALALRLPLGQSADWAKFILGLEVGWEW